MTTVKAGNKHRRNNIWVNSSFSPSNMSSLVLWLDANQGVYTSSGVLASDDETVSEWHDLSSSGLVGSQDTANEKPLFITNAINGLPVVSLGRAGFDLSFLDFGDNLNLNQDKTFIFVSKMDLSVAFGMLFTKTLESSDGYQLMRWNTLDRWLYVAGASMSGGGTEDLELSSYHVNSVVVNQTAGTVSYYVDGVEKGVDISLGATGAATGSTGHALLGARNSDTPNLGGSWLMAYFCMFDTALGDVDRGQLESFLLARFNL